MKRAAKIGIFLILSFVTVVSSLFISGMRVAYKVNYEGKYIATVKSKREFDSAVELVEKKVSSSCEEVKRAVSKPAYSTAIVPDSDINNEAEVAQAIIENTDEIVKSITVKVNGEEKARFADVDVEFYLKQRLDYYITPDTDCTAEYVETVLLEDSYHLSQELTDSEYVEELVSSLTVKTITNTVTTHYTDFNTVTQKDDNQLIGYTKVLVEGVKGVKQTTETVVAINGEETERTITSEVVISEPVDRVVMVGTARSVATEAERTFAKNSGFLFPLPNGKWKVVSYYGDGRNHKGVDLSAGYGVSIFSAKGGTVTYAGYKRDYGYHVVIDHGNGLQTRYAHASKLCVSAGDKVGVGEVIAMVGSTGNSTGNHLHFEVILNGKRVDPSPYIGLV